MSKLRSYRRKLNPYRKALAREVEKNKLKSVQALANTQKYPPVEDYQTIDNVNELMRPTLDVSSLPQKTT